VFHPPGAVVLVDGHHSSGQVVAFSCSRSGRSHSSAAAAPHRLSATLNAKRNRGVPALVHPPLCVRSISLVRPTAHLFTPLIAGYLALQERAHVCGGRFCFLFTLSGIGSQKPLVRQPRIDNWPAIVGAGNVCLAAPFRTSRPRS